MLNIFQLLVLVFVCVQACTASVEVLEPRHKPVPPQNKNFLPQSSKQSPQDVPDSLKNYQQLAVMAQQVNCLHSKINKTYGDAKLLYSWGNDDTDQRMHVYHSKSMGITFSWAGLNASSIASILGGADIFLADADKELFSWVESGSKVYHGFQSAYKRVAPIVEKKAKQYMKEYNDNRLSFTGLSYGAALSNLASMHLSHKMSSAKIHKVVVFGLPRIGNQQWANSVDKQLKGTFYYVVNGDDLVSRLPPRELGYQQPSGQIYINPPNSTHWKFYPGQENIHGSDSDWGINIKDHTGVYFSVPIGGFFGPCPSEIPKLLQ
ncbi:hypothetical protein MOBT1_000016 [Malassezia obtusa]|uniref:Fungal lipase-type domain-containing protein n=1 Tax=Malassezia obtusa TaxID=76774 RepID=A0AAF0IRQ0_9BASI|nr:hypothetical protein MOBT1_000016 [Malassezia obtusa]